jgi:hypothetical protein
LNSDRRRSKDFNKEEPMRYKNLIAVLLILGTLIALGIVSFARAEGLANTTTLAAGVSGVWFDGPDAPGPNLEASGHGVMSVSPHLSLVGMAAWGLTETYLRSTVGIRVTATDVDDPNFSVGLGVQYHTASVAALQPNEWCPDVAVGLRPWPARWPAVALVGLGWYGLDSGRAGCSVGARYSFHI